VPCAETGTEIADLATGLDLMHRRRGRTMSEKMAKARMKTGRPVKKMSPGKREEAIKLYGKRDWSVPAIAKHCGVSPMTLRKRMMEWTGVDEKTEAVMMADAGNWPPKRKVRV